jgi:hypothetical protein
MSAPKPRLQLRRVKQEQRTKRIYWALMAASGPRAIAATQLASSTQTANQPAPARRVMSFARERSSVVVGFGIALRNQVRADVRMLRARDLISLSCHEATAHANFLGRSDHFSAVIGTVAKSDEIFHI